MGLEIKRNSKGLYKLKSTISDELLHDDKWIAENEAKKVLIENEFCRFVEKAMEIYLDFPIHYNVNGSRILGNKKSFDYILNLCHNDYNQIFLDFNNVIDELKLSISKFEEDKENK